MLNILSRPGELPQLIFNLIFFAFQRTNCLIYPYPTWGSPYQTADHFWPYQNISDGLVEDVQGAAHTIVYNGGKIKQLEQLGSSLYFDGKDDWVDTGKFLKCSSLLEMRTYGCGFNADCVTNPSRCTDGFTVGFWLKVYGPGYIMSSGSFTNSNRGPGFRLVYDAKINAFEFTLETARKRWRLYVHGRIKKWMHMIFTWKESHGIEYYEDGNLSTYANKPLYLAARPRRYTPVITLGRPNNVFEVQKFGHFEIAQLAIWMKALSLGDSAGVYMAGVVYDQNTAVCCYFKSVGLCASNPCYDSYQCKRIEKNHKCLCPRVNLQLKTCQEKITGYCADKSKTCDLFSKQLKYCEHRTMREMCPRACHYCAPGSFATTAAPPVHPHATPVIPTPNIYQGSSVTLATPIPGIEPASPWPTTISPTKSSGSGSSVGIPYPTPTMPMYVNFTARRMPRGSDCETLECSYYAYCRVHKKEGFAQCHCNTDCSFEYAPVCGTNGKTYLNKCVLRAESCYIGQWIRVAKKGPCGSRYPNAAHYWPFNSTSSGRTLLDARGKCKTLTYNGVRTTYAEQLGPVLSLDGKDDFILISGFQSKCINDPTRCKNGLTVAFWLKFHSGEFILSAGRYTDHQRGPGFRFICENCQDGSKRKQSKQRKRFVLNLSTQTRDWEITLDFLPKAWFHFAFTWHKDHGLKVYNNGKLVVTDTTAVDVQFPPLNPRYEIVTLGRPNSLSKLHNYGKFEIGHLVMWTYELSHYEVEVAFLTVLAKTTKSLICCHFKKADPCVTNPCYDGATCRSLDEKFECICPDLSTGPCDKKRTMHVCEDRSDDCARYTDGQEGYCDYYKTYMMSICPKSCGFCRDGNGASSSGENQVLPTTADGAPTTPCTTENMDSTAITEAGGSSAGIRIVVPGGAWTDMETNPRISESGNPYKSPDRSLKSRVEGMNSKPSQSFNSINEMTSPLNPGNSYGHSSSDSNGGRPGTSLGSFPTLHPSPKIDYSRTARTVSPPFTPTPCKSSLSNSAFSHSTGPFADASLIVTPSVASQTVLSTASSVQSQRVRTTPTPLAPPPHTCTSDSRIKCICSNCPASRASGGLPCCTDLLDPRALKQGVSVAINSITMQDFLAKEPKMKQLVRDFVSDYCGTRDCSSVSNLLSRRRKRRDAAEESSYKTNTPAHFTIRIIGDATISPAAVSPEPGGASTAEGTLRGGLVDVNVVMFSISTDAADRSNGLSAAFYANMTFNKDGTNRTKVLNSDVLAHIVRAKRDTLNSKLDISVGAVSAWNSQGTRSSIQDFSSTPTLAGPTSKSGGSPNVGGRSGNEGSSKMSHTTFIIILVTGIGGFLVLSIIVTFILVRFLRRMKGEFVPDKAYPGDQKPNGGSDQLIPSFVDPSTPRITDVPKKPTKPVGGGGGAGGGGGGQKKQKKPMGVKVTYKPPKWD